MVEVMPTIDDGKDPKNPKKKKDVYVKEEKRCNKTKKGVDCAVHGTQDCNSVMEEAPKGKKYERMIKHIKRSYAKDGKLTKDEQSIADATAWKHKNKNK